VGSLGAPAFLAAPAGAVPRPAGGLGPIMPPAAAAMRCGITVTCSDGECARHLTFHMQLALERTNNVRYQKEQ
jgi:hypothetical protein